MTTFDYEIKKTATGKFYATKNGKRFTRINYARKWEARGVVQRALELYGVDQLNSMFTKVEAL